MYQVFILFGLQVTAGEKDIGDLLSRFIDIGQ